jgi:hypothetical protein
MLRELAETLDALAIAQPLVLVLEDLHWSDHATLDLLVWLARRREPPRLLVVGTYRPVEVIVQVYDRLSAGWRMQLHRQIGMRREAGYGEGVQEVAAELARHFEQGRDYARGGVSAPGGGKGPHAVGLPRSHGVLRAGAQCPAASAGDA